MSLNIVVKPPTATGKGHYPKSSEKRQTIDYDAAYHSKHPVILPTKSL